jgi:hypothetical protein
MSKITMEPDSTLANADWPKRTDDSPEAHAERAKAEILARRKSGPSAKTADGGPDRPSNGTT